jgi:hypothetical protein
MRGSSVTKRYVEKNLSTTPLLNYEFIHKWDSGRPCFFNHFLYENALKLKKECHPEIHWPFYLSNEPICSPAQSRETIPLTKIFNDLCIDMGKALLLSNTRNLNKITSMWQYRYSQQWHSSAHHQTQHEFCEQILKGTKAVTLTEYWYWYVNVTFQSNQS